MMTYKTMFLMSILATAALVESTHAYALRQGRAAACMEQCDQQKAREDRACRLSFEKCSAKVCPGGCQDPAADCSSECRACDVAQAMCLTDTDSRLLACQINCTN